MFVFISRRLMILLSERQRLCQLKEDIFRTFKETLMTNTFHINTTSELSIAHHHGRYNKIAAPSTFTPLQRYTNRFIVEGVLHETR